CNRKATSLTKCFRTDLQYGCSLLPLVFATLNHLYDFADCLWIESALAHNLINALVVFDVVFEDAVENLVRRETIDIHLVRPQLCGGRLGDGRLRNYGRNAIAILRQTVDHSLRHVRDYG